jgi:hypothetical protein
MGQWVISLDQPSGEYYDSGALSIGVHIWMLVPITHEIRIGLTSSSATGISLSTTFPCTHPKGCDSPTDYKPERAEIDRQGERQPKGNNAYDYDTFYDGFDRIVQPIATYNELYVRTKRVK